MSTYKFKKGSTMPKKLLALMLLLSGCAAGGTSGINAICDIQLPTVSVNDTDQTIIEVDNYSEKVILACKGK